MKNQTIEAGIKYHIKGDLENGFRDGKPFICHEEVIRKVTRTTDSHVICECGRKFLNNENLILSRIN